MRESGLFKEVGFQNVGQLIPGLMRHVTNTLPILFSAADLEEGIKPLLKPEKIQEILKLHAASLQDLSEIGQAALIADDPLSLRHLVLSRPSSLAPVNRGRIQNGRLVSGDGKHILIVAEPSSPGMDTRYASRVASLMASLSDELHKKHGGFTLTPVRKATSERFNQWRPENLRTTCIHFI